MRPRKGKFLDRVVGKRAVMVEKYFFPLPQLLARNSTTYAEDQLANNAEDKNHHMSFREDDDSTRLIGLRWFNVRKLSSYHVSIRGSPKEKV